VTGEGSASDGDFENRVVRGLYLIRDQSGFRQAHCARQIASIKARGKQKTAILNGCALELINLFLF
jgi:hypothetical protein